MTDDQQTELRDALRFALAWIDAVPTDVVESLPAMPGFDRDWADGLLVERKSVTS